MFIIYHAQAPTQLSASQPTAGVLAMAAQWCLKRNIEEKPLKRSCERQRANSQQRNLCYAV